MLRAFWELTVAWKKYCTRTLYRKAAWAGRVAPSAVPFVAQSVSVSTAIAALPYRYIGLRSMYRSDLEQFVSVRFFSL
jgi:hypothetical protein